MSHWELSKVNQMQNFLEGAIPPVKDLRFQIQSISSEEVVARAPLIENSNHMGTAFGGSLYSMLVLTSYTWLYAQLKDSHPDVEIVIQSGDIRYLKPVKKTIQTKCVAPPEESWQAFLQQLEKRGRARLTLTAAVLDGEMACVALDGQFVAFRK
jgi:thioesterase domain-containing protein